MSTLLLSIGSFLWPIIKPIIGPLISYLKGRMDEKKAIEGKAREGTTNDIEKANKAASDARDRANSGELHDSDYRD